MSRKNHKMVDGRLLQMDKRFSQLKQAQQVKINDWFYESYRNAFLKNKALPNARQEDEIYFEVAEKVNSAGIWIPGHELEKHYSGKKTSLRKRVLREFGQDVDYHQLFQQAQALVETEPHFIPALANISALLKDNLGHTNWAGFYLVTMQGNLVLGPFQGKVACIRIEKGKGVCGTALANNETVCVPNVHDFPGHIACDSASLSEIVVPVRDSSGAARAVLDIDSPMEDRFFDRDRENLEQLCQMIGSKIVWEIQ